MNYSFLDGVTLYYVGAGVPPTARLIMVQVWDVEDAVPYELEPIYNVR